MLQLKKGLNLESLGQPLKTALLTASQIGAQGVEINGRTQLHPQSMSRTAVRHLLKILADFKLSVGSIHFPTRRGFGDVEQLERRIEATKAAMTMAWDLRCPVVVTDIGAIPEPGHSDRQTMVEALTDIGMHAQKCGASLAIATGRSDGTAIAELMRELPPWSTRVDFDAAALMMSGHRVDDSMKAVAEYVAHFRARDAVHDLSAGRVSEVQLGRGSVDWPSLLGMLEEKSYQGFMTVQRENSDNAVTQCQESLMYLENLFA